MGVTSCHPCIPPSHLTHGLGLRMARSARVPEDSPEDGPEDGLDKASSVTAVRGVERPRGLALFLTGPSEFWFCQIRGDAGFSRRRERLGWRLRPPRLQRAVYPAHHRVVEVDPHRARAALMPFGMISTVVTLVQYKEQVSSDSFEGFRLGSSSSAPQLTWFPSSPRIGKLVPRFSRGEGEPEDRSSAHRSAAASCHFHLGSSEKGSCRSETLKHEQVRL